MKSNDNIPEDEMYLARMIAETRARGIGWCKGAYYMDATGQSTLMVQEGTCEACAIGAAALVSADGQIIGSTSKLPFMSTALMYGNEREDLGHNFDDCPDFDIGNAYRAFYNDGDE